MREINTYTVKEKVKELFLDACVLADEKLINKLEEARESELSPTGKDILDDMLENFKIAQEKKLPICQDTGMAIVFLDIGQDIFLTGEYLEDMVNQGVKEAYEEGYFRKSIVKDPIKRGNTGDNLPALVHTKIVPGDKLGIKVMAKGFGSENTSQLKMLKPSDGLEGVKDFVSKVVLEAIPNGCAPLVVGVGIGGDFESSALNAKKALLNGIDHENDDPFYKELENQILNIANNSGIGPMGLGGINSVLKVNIISAPTHIAGLPVAVNICCYVDRVKEAII